MRRSTVLVPLLALLACAPSAGATVWVPGTPSTPTASTSSALPPVERAVLRRINALRSANGLRALRVSTRLGVAARAKASEAARASRLDHASSDGTPMPARVRRYVRARAVGETLGALPLDTSDRAAAIVSLWMSSPMHRSTLLSPAYARAGVAVVRGPRYDVVAVDLASRR